MTTPNVATTLRLDRHVTGLSAGPALEVVLAVGVGDLAEQLFRHDPPTPVELEQAIDRVEDALAATGQRQVARGELLTADPLLLALLGLQADGDRLARDDVEALFQRLASASLGHPGRAGRVTAGREAAAALLILRECMHHLGYDSIRRAGA
jgi:exopolyphosphatase/pppGpp-phosphohydrolase